METLVDEPGTAIALVAFLALAVVVDRFWREVPALRSTEAGTTAAPGLSQQ